MEPDNNSVTIDIPKPRVCKKLSSELFRPKRISRVLLRTMEKRLMRPSDSTLSKFYMPCEKPLPSSIFKREEILIPYKTFSRAQKTCKHKQKLSIGIYDKYKVVNTDLKKRLYTENPPNEVQAVTDVDNRFFSSVNGRPIRDRVPLFKSLMVAAADLERLYHDIGNRHEAILNIEVNRKQELETYNLSLVRCMEQVKSFDKFISEDYGKSMSLLQKWEQLQLKLQLKVTEMENLANEEFTIISRLMGLDYLYGLQQKYGRFLYYLAPPSWRAKNREFAQSVEIEAKGFDLGISSEEETFHVIFDKMRTECLGKLVKPVLFFSHPHELLNIFGAIEKQQLNHFAYITHLVPPKKMLKDGIKFLNDVIVQDSAFVKNMICNFQKLLEFSNERCVELESRFYRILNGLFYESVGAPEVLNLFIHLEFCYEKIHAEKALNMDIVAMAKSLELCYMDYSKRLDALHSDTVKQAVTQSLELEKRKMRRARLAARELRLFDRLEREMLRAHKPSKPEADKIPLVKHVSQKSLRRERSKSQVKITEQKPLDETELEYLSLFTDWVEGDDPTKFLHRLDDEN